MIHSTGLLQRSWLEFEKRRTMDRALLQIQALLDQHTTKLTLTQSTYQCVAESAPAEDRLRYLHCIVYPAQYELKRDLAFRYLKCSVTASALNLFQELELWDEVRVRVRVGERMGMWAFGGSRSDDQMRYLLQPAASAIDGRSGLCI